jgi:hypothetical protein
VAKEARACRSTLLSPLSDGAYDLAVASASEPDQQVIEQKMAYLKQLVEGGTPIAEALKALEDSCREQVGDGLTRMPG